MINAEICDRVGQNSRDKAENYMSNGYFGRAFSHFLVALKLKPAWKDELKETFYEVLNAWSNKLQKEGRADDVWNCFSQAIEVFPENELIYNSCGLFFLSYGSYGAVQAISNFRKCLAIDEWNLEALRNLENACNLAVERWHFRMLNDEVRNCSFREAIIKKVRAGCPSVLDIGTGTGILSLFAVEAGADQIFACESSPVMTRLAGQVLDHLSSSDVKILEKDSTCLEIPGDLPSRVSLVVCEILDCGLLGEHVLETLIHAWTFLLQPSGNVIPQTATFHLCAIESQHIFQKWVVEHTPQNFMLSAYKIVAEDSSYDTEPLELIPFKRLTNIISPLRVNFNDIEDLKKVESGDKDVCITLICEEAGTIDCLAGWFSLRLDEDIVIDTKPNSEVKCWDQAIFPCSQLISVDIGQEITLLVSFQGGQTKVTFPDQVDTSKQTINVSQNVVSMLNDVSYVNVLQNTAEELTQTMPSRPCMVLDASSFPVLGLSILIEREGKDTLVSVCSAEGDKALVLKVAETVGGDVKFIDKEDLNSEKSHQFDIVVLPAVGSNGELDNFYLSQMPLFRKLLREDGKLVPERISVMGQLVESEWIRRVSRVVDLDVTCGYDIASFINTYKVHNQLDVRREMINAVDRSNVINLLDIDLLNSDKMLERNCIVPITVAGQLDALLYWHNIEFISNLTSFSTATSKSYFNVAAVLFDISVNETVPLLSKYQDGLFMTKITGNNVL